jgi:hypothetical protein
MNYSPHTQLTDPGENMKRIFRRDCMATDRHEIASLVDRDIPLLSKPLKAVIEESLRECGKQRYRKGTILTPTLCSLGSFGIGHPKGFWLSGGLELVGLRVAMVNLSFAPQVGSRRDAQS